MTLSRRRTWTALDPNVAKIIARRYGEDNIPELVRILEEASRDAFGAGVGREGRMIFFWTPASVSLDFRNGFDEPFRLFGSVGLAKCDFALRRAARGQVREGGATIETICPRARTHARTVPVRSPISWPRALGAAAVRVSRPHLQPITNEVRGINKVVSDTSGKPPATIERE
jgi:hypothetical protein